MNQGLQSYAFAKNAKAQLLHSKISKKKERTTEVVRSFQAMGTESAQELLSVLEAIKICNRYLQCK